MKKYISLILCLIVTNMIHAQSMRERLLRSDSTYIALQNVVKNIQIKYLVNDLNYSSILPDSVRKIMNETFLAIDKRRLDFDRMSLPNENIDEDEETIKWKRLTDSLINLNKIDLRGQMSFSFGVTTNQGYIGTQYALLLNKYRKFDFGLGIGMDYVNRGSGLVGVLQTPVFLTNKYFVSRSVFLNFDYGFTIPLSATYTDKSDTRIDFKESELNSNYFINIGFGALYSEKSSIQFNMRNQSLGVPEPLNQRVWMFGIKMNF